MQVLSQCGLKFEQRNLYIGLACSLLKWCQYKFGPQFDIHIVMTQTLDHVVVTGPYIHLRQEKVSN